MNQPPENEFATALTILNRYYRAMAARFAEEVVEDEDQFEAPFLGGAEALVEKYVQALRQLGEAYEILRALGEAIAREKMTQVGPGEFLCFGCRAVVRKEQGACPKCGWSWRKSLSQRRGGTEGDE